MSSNDQKILTEYDYDTIYNLDNHMKYCEMNHAHFKKWHKSWVKNIVMNSLYACDELITVEKYIFIYIYDMKAQQKYLPGIQTNQKSISLILWISDATLSRAIQKLVQSHMLVIWENQFWDKTFIPNENITTWWVSVDMKRLSHISALRKQNASQNQQVTEEFQRYAKMKEEIPSMQSK